MGPVSGLCVHSGIPVIIIENDGISRSEGDSEAPRPCAQQETENVLLRLEVHHHVPSVGDVAAPVQTEVLVAHTHHVFLEDVDHLCHLTEDQHTVVFTFKLTQQLVQVFQF